MTPLGDFTEFAFEALSKDHMTLQLFSPKTIVRTALTWLSRCDECGRVGVALQRNWKDRNSSNPLPRARHPLQELSIGNTGLVRLCRIKHLLAD